MILDAAKVLFAKRGYHHTNIENICEHLGISRGTVYLYFHNRKDVFTALLERMLERLGEAHAAAPRIARGTVSAKTRRGTSKAERSAFLAIASEELQRSLEAVFEDESSVRLLLRVAPGVHADIDLLLRRIEDVIVQRLGALFDAGIKSGVIRSDLEPRRLALFTIGGAQRLVLDALTQRKKKLDIAALAAEATSMVVGGAAAG